MGAKKVAAKALQLEITGSEHWAEFLKTPGLLIVDVYSEWSGPCTAMIGTLRKVKFEVAGDLVSYAVANNSLVKQLERFRHTCEPAWMFIQDGKMVNFMFGANGPELRKLLLSEIRRVQEEEPPEWSCPPEERGPEEQARFDAAEEIRKNRLAVKKAEEEAKERARREEYVEQMMFELCEETALLLYPWVFFSDTNEPLNKERTSTYSELKNDLFLECFDIVEERRFVFYPDDTETMDKFISMTEMEVTDRWKELICKGKCLVMRLRGKPPHEDWFPPYPNTCADGTAKCPVRAYDDTENYLAHIITEQPPPLKSTTVVRRTFEEPFWDRHYFVDEEDEGEGEGEEQQKTYPNVWFPTNAKMKVECFNLFFPNYMERYHPYVIPEPPLPFCAFKFEAEIFKILRETCVKYEYAINFIGVFENDRPPYRRLVSTVDDFINKVEEKTGREIMVVIVTRLNEEVFLSFAGIGAYFISEDQEEITKMILSYFPAGAVDILIYGQDDEEEEEGAFEYEGEGEFYGFEGMEEFEYGVIEI